MGTTKVALASQALTLLKGNSITSFSDNSNEADIVSLYWDTFIGKVFSMPHPWSFAMEKKQLSRLSGAPLSQYQYAFQIPAEAQRLYQVYDNTAAGAAPEKNWRIFGNTIEANNTTLYGEYTIYPNEGRWPGYFIDFAQYAFAAMIATPLTLDEGLAQTMHVMAYGTPSENERGGKYAVAAYIDSMQQPPEEMDTFELVSARFS